MITASIRIAAPIISIFVGVMLLAVAHADEPLASHIAALKSPNGEEAYHAVGELRKLGPIAAEAVPALIEAIRDERSIRPLGAVVSDSVGWAATLALAAIGEPSVRPLIELLSDQDAAVRLKAVYTLARIGKSAAAAEPVLRRLASKDEDSRVRNSALSAVPRISKRPPEEIVAFLRPWLSDKNPATRARTAESLGNYGGAAHVVVPELITAMDDDATYWEGVADIAWQMPVRQKAAKALGRIGPAAKNAQPRLRQMMREDRDRGVRVAAAGAIARIDASDTESIEYLISALEPSAEGQNPDTDVLSHIADLPHRFQSAIGKVEALTAHEDSWVQVEAIRTLRALSGTKAIPILTQALKDEDEFVRATAAEQLGELGPSARSAVNDLIARLRSEDDFIDGRAAAVKAMVKIGDPADVIVTALCNALDGSVYLGNDLFTIVDALEHFGAKREAAERLAALAASAEDSCEGDRENAEKALRRLTQDTER